MTAYDRDAYFIRRYGVVSDGEPLPEKVAFSCLGQLLSARAVVTVKEMQEIDEEVMAEGITYTVPIVGITPLIVNARRGVIT